MQNKDFFGWRRSAADIIKIGIRMQAIHKGRASFQKGITKRSESKRNIQYFSSNINNVLLFESFQNIINNVPSCTNSDSSFKKSFRLQKMRRTTMTIRKKTRKARMIKRMQRRTVTRTRKLNQMPKIKTKTRMARKSKQAKHQQAPL